VRQVRNGIEESVHRGDIVEVDAAGRLIRQLGDPDRIVTLRSTVKPFGAFAMGSVAGGVGVQWAVAAFALTGLVFAAFLGLGSARIRRL